jgi:hypothetical protein
MRVSDLGLDTQRIEGRLTRDEVDVRRDELITLEIGR